MFQEEQNRGKPNWEHLNDELHVLITVEDSENRAQLKLERAVDEVKKLLTVVSKFDIIERLVASFCEWQLCTIPHRHELSTCPANVTNKLGWNLFDCYQGIMAEDCVSRQSYTAHIYLQADNPPVTLDDRKG